MTFQELETIILEIEKRWLTSSITKTHHEGCHLEHWSCAIGILVDELRKRMAAKGEKA